MSDLISRTDAIAALTKVALQFGITGEPQIMIVAKNAISDLPAYEVTVKPEWMTNCAVCGRVVDTREVSEGGDAHGCEYAAGWACSSECAEKLSPNPDWMTEAPASDVEGLVALVEALEKALNFIANTESEMGETLPSGDAARAALAAYKGLK